MGLQAEPFSFIASDVAAWIIGTAKLTNAQLDNGGTPFGLAANDIGHVYLRQDGTDYTWPARWLADPDDLVVRLV